MIQYHASVHTSTADVANRSYKPMKRSTLARFGALSSLLRGQIYGVVDEQCMAVVLSDQDRHEGSPSVFVCWPRLDTQHLRLHAL